MDQATKLPADKDASPVRDSEALLAEILDLTRGTAKTIAAFAGGEIDVPSVAASLYDTRARTYRTGTVDEWATAFNAGQLSEFETRYGDILDTYGYARLSGAAT